MKKVKEVEEVKERTSRIIGEIVVEGGVDLTLPLAKDCQSATGVWWREARVMVRQKARKTAAVEIRKRLR